MVAVTTACIGTCGGRCVVAAAAAAAGERRSSSINQDTGITNDYHMHDLMIILASNQPQ